MSGRNHRGTRAASAIDTYLDQVAQAMGEGGASGPEIVAAVESLREQILELAGDDPSDQRLEDVIATLEPPAAYSPAHVVGAERAAEPATPSAWTSSLAWLSIVLALGSWGVAFALENTGEGGFLAVLCLLAGIAAGVASWRNPLGRFGALTSILFLVLLFLIPLFEG